jgi:hypothetical protein
MVIMPIEMRGFIYTDIKSASVNKFGLIKLDRKSDMQIIIKQNI